MINFNLPQHEWQKDMDIILQNVSLGKIDFFSANSILFCFTDTYNGDDSINLICDNVWKHCGEYCFEDEDDFPIFIGDVRTLKLTNSLDVKSAFDYFNYSFGIPKGKAYNLVCIDSGDISVQLVCETVSMKR